MRIDTSFSPILMAYPDADIFVIDEELKKIKYEETEHYQITRNFLNNTRNMLDILLE